MLELTDSDIKKNKVEEKFRTGNVRGMERSQGDDEQATDQALLASFI